MPKLPAHTLDARARRLLRSLIAQYLLDGEPVGSRTLSRSSGLDISAATIRNILADLEDAGLLASPHTSAGRIPTPRGLRLFVDSLIELKPLPRGEMARLQRALPPPEPVTTRDLLGNVSHLLSAITHFAGVVTVPRQEDFPLRHIDFVALSEARVLVILVFSDNQVQNRVVQLPKLLDNRGLEQAANYINTHFVGLRIDDIRAHLLAELREAGSELNRLLSSAVELAAASFAVGRQGDVLVSGQTNLMNYADLADLAQLRELFDAFQQKNELLQLMEMCAKAPGVRLFIGEEAGFAPLDGCSVVTASYGVQGRVLGALGVIGPTRMAYERVIPVVQATANLLSDALNHAAAAL